MQASIEQTDTADWCYGISRQSMLVRDQQGPLALRSSSGILFCDAFTWQRPAADALFLTAILDLLVRHLAVLFGLSRDDPR